MNAHPTVRPLARRLVSAVFLAGSGSVFTLGLSSLASIAVARNGGPEVYALFVGANMLLFLGSVFATSAIPLAIAKHLARFHDDDPAVGHAFATAGLLAVAAIAVVLGIAVAIGMPVIERMTNLSLGPAYALAFAPTLVLASVADTSMSIYSGILRPGRGLVVASVGPSAMLVYAAALVAGAPIPAWGAPVVSYVASGLTAIFLMLSDGLLARPGSFAVLKPLVSDLAPSVAFNFQVVAMAWIDRFIVASSAGVIGLGLYSSAAAVIQAFLRVPKALAYQLVPASAKVATSAEHKMAEFNDQAVSTLTTLSGFCVFVLVLFPHVWIAGIFGPGFEEATGSLLLMAPALLFAAISIPSVAWMMASKSRYLPRLVALSTLFRIAAVYALVDRFGIAGAAIGGSLAELFLGAAAFYLGRRGGMPLRLRAAGRGLAITCTAVAAGAVLSAAGGYWKLFAVAPLLLFVPALRDVSRLLIERSLVPFLRERRST